MCELHPNVLPWDVGPLFDFGVPMECLVSVQPCFGSSITQSQRYYIAQSGSVKPRFGLSFTKRIVSLHFDGLLRPSVEYN